MTRLVNDLLDVSRITQGKIELRREDMNLTDAVADALEVIRPAKIERGLRLVMHQPDPSPVIHADRVRITQIMENLLSNACKYTDAGGCITVDISQDSDWAIIRVSDTGIGIPANRLTHIFDLFTQIDVAIDRSQGGLGIGLALVRSLVALHAGTVTAFSEGAGKGSTFEVRLPRAHPD
jgi:signal transduction histidine kinase